MSQKEQPQRCDFVFNPKRCQKTNGHDGGHLWELSDEPAEQPQPREGGERELSEVRLPLLIALLKRVIGRCADEDRHENISIDLWEAVQRCYEILETLRAAGQQEQPTAQPHVPEYPHDDPTVQALERGYRKWEESSCHEPGCGCVTVWMWRELVAAGQVTSQPVSAVGELRKKLEHLPYVRHTMPDAVMECLWVRRDEMLGALLIYEQNAGRQERPRELRVGQEVWVRGEVCIIEVNGEECESGTPTQDDYVEVAFNDTACGPELIDVHPRDLRAALAAAPAALTRSETIELLHDLISCEVESVKQNNRPQGITKKLLKQERDLIDRVFAAMCADGPLTESEYGDILP